MRPPRRTLGELRALYVLEPTLTDFYVEGRTDRVFLEVALQGTRAKIVEIDDVFVPPDYLANLSLGAHSNRDRVVALARWLEDELSDSVTYRVRCVVDADFDRLLGRAAIAERFLRLSDFACVEAYWFTP